MPDWRIVRFADDGLGVAYGELLRTVKGSACDCDADVVV